MSSPSQVEARFILQSYTVAVVQQTGNGSHIKFHTVKLKSKFQSGRFQKLGSFYQNNPAG